MIIVYGADWCEDTRRALRLLRRLGVRYEFYNVDEDLDALGRAKALTGGMRRTPIIDLGLQGGALIEPDNDTIAAGIAEGESMTAETIRMRREARNVGDFERLLRTAGGAGLALAAGAIDDRRARWSLRLAGGALALSGLAGWCPGYSAAAVTSIDGPGDHPAESQRRAWLAPAREVAR